MIQRAKLKDLNRILEIYQSAREFMRQSGNVKQWGAAYPTYTMLENDIKNKQLYTLTRDEMIHAVFAFIIGDDPAYTHIEKGTWKSDGTYGVIHRIASDGTAKGVFSECLDYCKSKINYIRIDTHEDNLIMQHIILKNQFIKSGVIYLKDGSPRLAYEYFKPILAG